MKPGSASGGTRTRRAAVAALVLLLLLAGWWWGSPAVDPGPRPSETAAGRSTVGRRTGVLPDDPWEALLALEVERLHAEADRRALVNEAVAHRASAGLPDDPAALQALPLDYSTLARLAEEAMETWAGEPVADYAALYLLQAYAHPYSAVRSPDGVAEVSMGVLRQGDDVLVREAALTELSNVAADVRLGPEDLDLLLEVYDAPDARLSQRHALTVAALESALALGDDARARPWMARHHAATDEECAPEVVASRAGTEDWCRKTNQARDNRSSYLAAIGVGQPTTWQAAVGAIVRRCDLEGHRMDGEELRGSATWTGEEWTWGGWSASSELARCVELTPHEGPEPPPDARVDLRIHAARPALASAPP